MKKLSRGSMLMEAVLVLPVLLMLIFAVLQYANILMVQQLVEYAAYSAARSTLTCNAALADIHAKDAAMRILAPVSLSKESDDADDGPHVFPGWGKLSGTKDLEDQVSVEFMPDPRLGLGVVGCTVKFDYPLLMWIPSYKTTNGVIRLEGKAILPFRAGTLQYPMEVL